MENDDRKSDDLRNALRDISGKLEDKYIGFETVQKIKKMKKS